MEISVGLIFYLLFTLAAIGTGITYWVINRYRIPSVISFILGLLAPLLTLIVYAQGEKEAGVFAYIMEQMSAGNAWARLVVVIHAYLLIWVLFLLVRGIIYLIKSPDVRDKYKKIIARFHSRQEEQAEPRQQKQ